MVARLNAVLCLLALALAPGALGAQVHPVESELRRDFPSLAIDSSATFETSDTFVGHGLTSGLRARDSGTLRVLYPRSYDGMMVAEVGAQRVVLRPTGALGTPAVESNGKLIYSRPYASTDVVEVPNTGRSEELLLLRDPHAPRVYEYEIVSTEGVAAVVLANGAIRFLPKLTGVPPPSEFAAGRFVQPAPSLQIDRPWIIDAAGRRSESHARWTVVGNGPIPTRIRLVVQDDDLAYPLLVDPSFSATGNMTTARKEETGTLLPNGKVLIAGGRNTSGTPLSSAELYDPATGTFSLTGSLGTARYNHTATLLLNGKVLIAGGFGAVALDSAELYDPAAGTFGPTTGNLATARINHTATLLKSGKVLIAGGNDATGTSLQSAELYDPSSGTNGTFVGTTGNMGWARTYYTATLLPSGKVLLAGGAAFARAAEVYNPAAGTYGSFSATGDMNGGRENQTATLLPSGKVLIAGGDFSGNQQSSAELYDPAANAGVGAFSFTGGMSTARTRHAATLLANGNVLIAGGNDATGTSLQSAEVYDSAAGTFSSTGGLVTAREGQITTLLPNGRVLNAGGVYSNGFSGTTLSSAELYEPAAGTFSSTGNLSGRRYAAAVLLSNGTVLIAGGQDSANLYLTSATLYNPATGTFSATGSMAAGRVFHTATLLPNGKVLIAGGYNQTGSLGGEIYNPATGTFSATGLMGYKRAYHTATLLPNGKVLIAGGSGNGPGPSAELFDPAAGTFSATTGSMTAFRYYHAATLLPNGKVLIAGGAGHASAELYDPGSNAFSTTGTMSTSRDTASATLLPNGKVLIAGGYVSYPSGSPLNSAELYDPDSESFSTTGSLGTVRPAGTTTLLPNGKVLFAGGFNAGSLATAELYDPAAGTFSATGNLTAARDDDTATLLPSGKVLIAAGVNGSSQALTTAELYDPGLGFAASRRPVITSATLTPPNLTLTGTGFLGDSEAASGGTNSSATNYPLVQLQRIDNDQVSFVSATSSLTDTSWSGVPANLANGWFRVTVFTNAVPSTQQLLLVVMPDLTVTKSHVGSFAQGQTGATYTLTVNNIGAASSGTVTVTDTLPAGLTASDISGSGWNCTLGTLTCTRSDVLAASSSYPPITVTVNVANDAPSSVTNLATVSGGGETNTANDSASDPTTVTQLPDLTLTKTHTGNFRQGQSAAEYSITVSNVGFAPTSGTVVVTDTIPSGLTATAITGLNWNCTLATLSCSRSSVLPAGSSYPDSITVAVNVANDAPSMVTNSATVSGGGETNTANDTANDPTNVTQVADLVISKSHAGNFAQGQTGATYTLAVSNIGPGPTDGTPVIVTDTLPTGLTATAISGPGWNCTLGTPTSNCTRSDVLGIFPAITLTVNVASNAAASLINSASVSGGGELNTANDSASDPTTVLPPPDLSIGKSHAGNFTQGQVGATYFITVSNVGSGPTYATVSVHESIPTGLTATAISGTNWNCTLGTLTCARSDVLAGDSAYPEGITVTVNVANNAPSMVTNSATVSGGGELNTANDTANDPTTIVPASSMAAPPNFGATAISTMEVSLTWDAVAGATSYQVFRSSDGVSFGMIGSSGTNSFTNSGLTPNTAYVYYVQATDGVQTSLPSVRDLATTIVFTDDPIVAGSTVIKAIHLAQLRTAIDAVRAGTGGGPATYTNAIAVGGSIQATDVAEMRAFLDAARADIGVPAIQYTDPTLTAGSTIIKASHIQELRDGVK